MSMTLGEGQYLETEHGRIFLVWHAPRSPIRRESAVLLFYPGLLENMRGHWGLRQLAQQLASEGWPVMRFDYYGTGDSEGETGVGTLHSAVRDGVAAANKLLEISGQRHIQLVGLRFGAMVAALVSHHLEAVNCILWDPMDGGQNSRKHGENLAAQMRKIDLYTGVKASKKNLLTQHEIIGYPLYPEITQQLEAFDWHQALPRSLSTFVVYSRAPGKTPSAFTEKRGVHMVVAQDQASWDSYIENQKALLAPSAQQIIARIVGGQGYE